MPISGMTILDDSTAQAAPTGGAAATLTEDGVSVPNGKHVADAGNADFLTRLNATFRNRPPALQADGTWSKAKRSAMIVQPKELADGSYVFNLVRIEFEIHPESTAAEKATLRYNGSQLLTDADVDDFINNGSLA
jgi:hypothetical protein